MNITTVFRFAIVAIPNIFRVWGILWRKKRIADQASLHETVILRPPIVVLQVGTCVRGPTASFPEPDTRMQVFVTGCVIL